jgi:hypothetical protein
MTPTELFEHAGRTLFGDQYVESLADLLGVGTNTVGKWRDGKSCVPPEVWCEILDAVGEHERSMGTLRRELLSLVGPRTDSDLDPDGRQLRPSGIFPAVTLDVDLWRRFSRTRRRV